jgi:hypothetical protein
MSRMTALRSDGCRCGAQLTSLRHKEVNCAGGTKLVQFAFTASKCLILQVIKWWPETGSFFPRVLCIYKLQKTKRREILKIHFLPARRYKIGTKSYRKTKSESNRQLNTRLVHLLLRAQFDKLLLKTCPTLIIAVQPAWC